MERREDRARADGVHTNALRRVVGGERPRQARDRGLGGVVLQVAAACDHGTNGGDVDDGATLIAAHQRNRRLGTEDVAHQVDAEDLVPTRRARLVNLLVFADAGIVDENVEAPELLRGAVDEAQACGSEIRHATIGPLTGQAFPERTTERAFGSLCRRLPLLRVKYSLEYLSWQTGRQRRRLDAHVDWYYLNRRKLLYL
jgi:hypothetical protein